jgi:hypothetical protein
MITRRITACACALALAVPAVASARPGFDAPVAYGGAPVAHSGGVVYGDTKYDTWPPQAAVVYGDTKYDTWPPQAAVEEHRDKQDLAAKGDTKNDVTSSYADKVGSLSAEQLAAAYGTTKPTGTPVASPSVGSPEDGTNGWRIAAVAEAGLLAAITLGSALLVVRTRPRRSAAA